MMGKFKTTGPVTAAVGTALLVAGAAHAEEEAGAPQARGHKESEALVLESVVVTVRYRREDVQHVAGAVTALDGETLAKNGTTNLSDIASMVPQLEVAASAGPYQSLTQVGVNAFAVSAFSESSTAVSTNGVYISRPTGFQGMFYDIDRVEIVNGPQGTLYGRNSTGGAINILTKRPDLDGFAARGAIEVGSEGRQVYDAMVNVPLSSTTAVRFAAQSLDHDGFYSDGSGDAQQRAGRISLLSRLGSDITVTLVADYAHQGGFGPGATAITTSGPVGGDPWTGILNQQNLIIANGTTLLPSPRPLQSNNYTGIEGDVEWRIGAGTLYFIPGYRDIDTNFVNTSGGFFVNERSRSHQETAELRWTSPADQALQYLAGAYFFKEDIADSGFFDQSLQGVSRQLFALETKSTAAYAQLIWSVTSSLRLTGGGRYTYEEKSANGSSGLIPQRFLPPAPPPLPTVNVLTLDASRNDSKATWMAGLEFDITPTVLAYASVGTGFKSGGFYSGPIGSNTYRPETDKQYAIGVKSRFFNKRLQANIEASYTDYYDQQVVHLDRRVAPNGTTLTVQATDNIGRATFKGIGGDIVWLPLDHTRLDLKWQYLDNVYDSLQFRVPQLGPAAPAYGCPYTLVAGFYQVNCDGFTAPQSPKWAFVAGLNQEIPVGSAGLLTFDWRTRYQSERETRLNYLPTNRAPAYAISDLSIAFLPPDRMWQAGVYVRNVTNRAAIGTTFVHASYPTVPVVTASYYDPRQYGFQGSINF